MPSKIRVSQNVVKSKLFEIVFKILFLNSIFNFFKKVERVTDTSAPIYPIRKKIFRWNGKKIKKHIFWNCKTKISYSLLSLVIISLVTQQTFRILFPIFKRLSCTIAYVISTAFLPFFYSTISILTGSRFVTVNW